MTVKILEYVDAAGRSPFRSWFNKLDIHAAAKLTITIEKIRRGLGSNLKSLGGGVFEARLSFGPGYRIYCGTETDGRLTTVVILLCGGTKSRQQSDIDRARRYWKDYRQRKRMENRRWH